MTQRTHHLITHRGQRFVAWPAVDGSGWRWRMHGQSEVWVAKDEPTCYQSIGAAVGATAGHAVIAFRQEGM